jgi:ribose-phosphate pyrophosphokinase
MNTRRLPPEHRASVFSLRSGHPLAARVCRALGVEPAPHEEREFEDGEHKIRPLESVRGRDVYLVESLHGDQALSVDQKLARVSFFAATLRDAGARRVTCVAPYLCYARKDRRTKPRDPVTIRYVACLLEALGVDRVVTVDVHNPAAYENAFRIPAEHLTAAPLWVRTLVPLIGPQELAVVSPDAGGAKRGERLRQALERGLGRGVGSAFVDKTRSEGVLRSGEVVGAVEGRVVVLVDDLISTGATLARAAAACRARGARAVYAVTTHGVFSADASQVLRDSALERLFILDTIPPARVAPDLLSTRVQVLDCAPLLARAIHRLHVDEDGDREEYEEG